MVPMLRLWLGIGVVVLRQRFAHGQIYQMENVRVPANRSLLTLQAFYIYSLEEAPEKKEGSAPFIKFTSMQATPMSGGDITAEMEAYEGIQVSIMRYRDFWAFIHPDKFCSTQQDVLNGIAEKKDQLLVQKARGSSYRDVGVYSTTVHFSVIPQKDTREIIQNTGVYIFTFSNCGPVTDAQVSGTVIVKNAYGFLPGNEYHKLPFYGWLLVVYVGLALIWMCLSVRWWKELFAIQNCIAAVIFFGLLESFLWFLLYTDWNKTGTRGKFLFVLSILLTVVKSTFSYLLVLVASLGWGVTRPYLDAQVILKIQVLAFVYIVLDFIREAVLQFRTSHSLSVYFVLLCLLPVSLLNGGIFSWVFQALSSLLETLKERRQFEKLILFERLWKILVFAMAVATLTLLSQIFLLSKSVAARWKYQWLITDGIAHGVFVFVLGAMMYLWAPHKSSQRYAFSQQVAAAEAEVQDHPGAVWADEDALDDEGEDGESFWATTKGMSAFTDTPANKAEGEVIGAAS